MMEKLQKNKYSFSSIKPLILISDEVIEIRSEQIGRFISELITYKVLLRDLVNDKFSYSVRNELLNIAMFITEESELYDEFLEKKEIPISKLCISQGLDKKYIEKYRDYIVAYVLIFGNPTYKYIQDYFQIIENKEVEVGTDIIKYEPATEVDGIIVAKGKKNAIILTIIGEFKKIKLPQGAVKGDEVKSKEKKGLSDYKLYISIVAIFIVVFILALTYKYNDVKSTIVVETTSSIRMDINSFNRIVKITSPTEKGNILIEDTNILDQNIDKALCIILDYALNNEMVKAGGIVVTVTGKPLKYNALSETEEYIYQKNMSVRFNNSGSEHKIE